MRDMSQRNTEAAQACKYFPIQATKRTLFLSEKSQACLGYQNIYFRANCKLIAIIVCFLVLIPISFLGKFRIWGMDVTIPTPNRSK